MGTEFHKTLRKKDSNLSWTYDNGHMQNDFCRMNSCFRRYSFHLESKMYKSTPNKQINYQTQRIYSRQYSLNVVHIGF